MPSKHQKPPLQKGKEMTAIRTIAKGCAAILGLNLIGWALRIPSIWSNYTSQSPFGLLHAVGMTWFDPFVIGLAGVYILLTAVTRW